MNKPPFDIACLDHVVLRTENLQQLLAFYQLLGCTVVRDMTAEIGMVQLRMGQSMLDIVDVNGPAGKRGDPGGPPGVDGRNLDHFAIRIDPYDEAEILAFFAERGIDTQVAGQPLLGAQGFGPAITIADPQGNRVELKGPAINDQSAD